MAPVAAVVAAVAAVPAIVAATAPVTAAAELSAAPAASWPGAPCSLHALLHPARCLPYSDHQGLPQHQQQHDHCRQKHLPNHEHENCRQSLPPVDERAVRAVMAGAALGASAAAAAGRCQRCRCRYQHPQSRDRLPFAASLQTHPAVQLRSAQHARPHVHLPRCHRPC